MTTATSRSTQQQQPLQMSLLLWGALILGLQTSHPLITSVDAWVPPLTANGRIDSSFETVQAMRKRLGIAYNYTPSLLHPENCRYVSEEECQHADESLQQHAQTHVKHIQQNRALREQQQQRQLQRPDINHNPNLGKIKVLILLIQFPDHNGRNLISKSDIEDIWNGEISNWLTTNSGGNYEMDPVVLDWVVTDKSEKDYAGGVQGFTPTLQEAMYPALDMLDNDPNWDWGPYDSDNNGFLDSVVMMHSGVSAVVTTDADCFGQEAMDRIWPHAWATTNRGWASQREGLALRLNGYTVNSVFEGTCDDAILTTGITCHEYMHTMNLIDLYDGTDLFTAQGVGAWDIMSHPYGADNSGTPGLLSTWSKMEAEWIEPTMINGDGIFVAKPTHEGLYAFRIDIAPGFALADEYLLIENRQPIGFEENLWGKGLLIVHIDDAAQEQEFKGFPGQNGWPANGNHYMVAVLQADGNYDLENNVNFGDAGDLFDVGSSLGPGMGNTVFPNTDSYQLGVITETGIKIDVLSQEGNDITFEVSGYGQQNSPAAPAQGGGGDNPGAPNMAPTEGVLPENVPGSFTDRWVLSRAPGPTRPPFVLPEFPVQKPEDNILHSQGLSSSGSPLWNGRGVSMLVSVSVCIIGSLLY